MGKSSFLSGLFLLVCLCACDFSRADDECQGILVEVTVNGVSYNIQMNDGPNVGNATYYGALAPWGVAPPTNTTTQPMQLVVAQPEDACTPLDGIPSGVCNTCLHGGVHGTLTSPCHSHASCVYLHGEGS